MSYFRTRHTPFVVFFCALMLGTSLMAHTAFAESFGGTFSGDGLSLTLKPVPQNPDSYTGTLAMKGQKIPVKGRFDPAKGFFGTFESGGEQFSFSLQRQGAQLILTSDNTTYNLKAQDSQPATTSKNPLARPKRNPLVANKNKTQPPGTPTTGHNNNGYLGLATITDDEDQIRAMMVVAGGPAEKAGVRRGDVIRELNGQPVTSNDELAGAMRGPVGSKVTLLLGREKDEGKFDPITVTITRGAMPGTQGETTNETPTNETPTNETTQRTAENAPATLGPNQPDGNPGAVAGLPAFLKPGTRLIYHQGDSVIHGASSHLVPSPDGKGWQDDRGRMWNPKENQNSGGVAYVTLDIVHASRDFIAADARTYLIGLNDQPVATGGAALTGNAKALGDVLAYWMNPAHLAGLRQGRLGGQTINRVGYELNGQTYDAISISSNSEKIYESEIYDLKTGLLLSSSRSYEGDAVAVNNGGTLGQSKGATVISHARFIGTRELNIPWANAPAPHWATAGRQLDYQGTTQAVIQGSSLPPLPASGMALSFSIQRAVGKCVLVKMLTRSETGSGLPPQENASDRCYGSSSLTGLWISPDALKQLQPNQVIDQDGITRRRTVFVGVQGNEGVFMEQGPVDTIYSGYDMQSGMLVGYQSAQQMADIGQRQMQLRFVGTR